MSINNHLEAIEVGIEGLLRDYEGSRAPEFPTHEEPKRSQPRKPRPENYSEEIPEEVVPDLVEMTIEGETAQAGYEALLEADAVTTEAGLEAFRRLLEPPTD